MRLIKQWDSVRVDSLRGLVASLGLSLHTWLGKGVAPSTCSEGAIVLPRSDILLCED